MDILKRLATRLSFNFFAIQGLLILAMLFMVLLETLLLFCIPSVDRRFLQVMPFVFVMALYPIIIFYSFVIFCIIRKFKIYTVNSWYKMFFSAILLSLILSCPYCQMGMEGAPGFGIGGAFLFFWGVFAGLISVLLFSLLPSIILHYKEIRTKLVIESSPFLQNKFLLCCVILGIITYLILIIICVFFALKFMLNF